MRTRISGARRRHGELESAVLQVLLAASAPLNAGEVRDRLIQRGLGSADDLAYTTVVTVLTRLQDKGSLVRQRDGRAYKYSPVADETGLAARRLAALLDANRDRDSVLARFVTELSDRDEQLIRALLDERGTDVGDD